MHLTPIEFDLLRVLARNRGRLMTHRRLLTDVWGPEYADDVQVLRTHIARLRAKIEAEGSPRLIVTDPGVGYRLSRAEPLRNRHARGPDRYGAVMDAPRQECRPWTLWL